MSQIVRTPLHDAMSCISCQVPATVRGLDHSHIIPRSQAPDRVDDPTNIVLQCRPEHDLIGAKKARQRVEAVDVQVVTQEAYEWLSSHPDEVMVLGQPMPLEYVFERWSDEKADFEEIRRVRVVVDKKRGHLVKEE